MATCNFKLFCLVSSFILHLTMGLASQGAQISSIGVCYGMFGDNLPSPKEVVSMYKSHGIQMMRIYEPNPALLNALHGSGIRVLLGINSKDIPILANSYPSTKEWIERHIKPYLPHIHFRYIAVGDEAIIAPETKDYVLRAMKNLHKAISDARLEHHIKVSTVVGISVISSIFPPSDGAFTNTTTMFMTPIAHFLEKIGSPLLIKIFPSFRYTSHHMPLDYALFLSDEVVVNDGYLKYTNLFDTIIDAFRIALKRAGTHRVSIVVAATGWPSNGYPPVSSPRNAQIYNSNLIRHVLSCYGTPMLQGCIETYIYNMFNEKNTQDAHWGLFKANKEPVYSLRFSL